MMNFLSVSGGLIGKAASWARRTSALYLDTEAPTIPANLAEDSVTDGTITLTFDAATDNFAVKEYRLYEYADSTYTRVTSGVVFSGLSVTISGLGPGTQKVYAVTAVDFANNESGYSDTASAQTSTGTDTTVPVNSLFTLGDPAVNDTDAPVIQWTASDNVTSVANLEWIYYVSATETNPWIGDNSGAPDEDTPNPTSPAEGTWGSKPTTIDVGSSGTWYVYCSVKDENDNVATVLYDTVTASTDAYGNYWPSYDVDQSTYWVSSAIEVGGATNPLVPPDDVEIIILSSTTWRASWTPLANTDGVAFYGLRWYEGGGSYAVLSDAIPLTQISGGKCYYDYASATASTLQHVEVRSLDSDSNTSAWSVEATGTTPPATVYLPHPDITGLTAPSYNSLQLSYTVPADTGDTEVYNVYNFATGAMVFMNQTVPIPTGSRSNIATIPASASTEYKIVLRASGLGQEGADSNYVAPVTTAAAPSGAIFSDNFDTGSKDPTAPYGGSWGTPSPTVVVSNDYSVSSSYSLKFPFPATSAGINSAREQRFVLNDLFPELWVQFDMRIPDNYINRLNSSGTTAGQNDKFFAVWGERLADYTNNIDYHYNPILNPQLWPKTASDEGSKLIMNARSWYEGVNPPQGDLTGWKYDAVLGAWYLNRNWWGGTDGVSTYWNFITESERGLWVRYKFQMKLASAANNDGIYKLWKTVSGTTTQCLNITDGNWYSTDSNGTPSRGFFCGYLLGTHNGGYAEPTDFYIDNFSVAETEAQL